MNSSSLSVHGRFEFMGHQPRLLVPRPGLDSPGPLRPLGPLGRNELAEMPGGDFHRAMPDRVLQITRRELVLGSLPERDALELLRLGFFQPDDWFHWDGMPERRPLSELAAAAATATMTPVDGESALPGPRIASSWLERARESVTGVAGAMADSASSVAGRLRSLVTETPTVVTQATNAVLEGYLPQIRSAVENVNSRAIQAVQGGVRDDELMLKTFGAVYDCLPKPVCRFVSEERFILFCLEHRNRLLGTGESSGKEPNPNGMSSQPEPPAADGS